MNNTIIKKYTKLYMKRNWLLSLFCGFIVFIPLVIAAITQNYYKYDLLISFFPLVISLLCVLPNYSHISEFRSMIEKQEKEFSVNFSDTNCKQLQTTLFLSDNWLINAGISAFYKNNIIDISSEVHHSRNGSSNLITLQTADGIGHTFWVLRASDVEKIKSWAFSKPTSCFDYFAENNIMD